MTRDNGLPPLSGAPATGQHGHVGFTLGRDRDRDADADGDGETWEQAIRRVQRAMGI